MTTRELRDLALQGDWPFIPNPCEITREHVPYLDPSTYSIISGNSSAGKSSYAKHWMLKYVEFAIRTKTKFKIIWIALEETEEQFRYSIKSYLLGKLDYDLSMADMLSVSINPDGTRRILSDHELAAIESIQLEYEKYMDYFILEAPRVKNPTGIYKFIRNVAKQHGKFYHEDKELTESQIGIDKFDKYVPGEIQFIVVIDNINNITEEQGMDKKRSIRKLCGEYINHYVTKYFKMHTICLQQQWKASMNLDHVQAGHIYPTMDGLADDKETGNDCRLFIGITDPFEHEKFDRWPLRANRQFKREDYKDIFRVISIPKNTLFGARITTTDRMIPVNFQPKRVSFSKL